VCGGVGQFLTSIAVGGNDGAIGIEEDRADWDIT
jgi:hypothetical protein